MFFFYLNSMKDKYLFRFSFQSLSLYCVLALSLAVCFKRCKWGIRIWYVWWAKRTNGSKVMSQSIINNNFLSTQEFFFSQPTLSFTRNSRRAIAICPLVIMLSHSMRSCYPYLVYRYRWKWANLVIIFGSRLENYFPLFDVIVAQTPLCILFVYRLCFVRYSQSSHCCGCLSIVFHTILLLP